MGKKRFSNGLKTGLLFAVMWALLLLVGYLIAYGTGSSAFIWIFAGIGLISTFYSYWNSDKIAIRSMNAYPVDPGKYPQIVRIVTELSQTAGQPVPRMYIAPTSAPNAFATGRNPQNAAVCCTEGILQLLDERELRGVLAHELMHVYNRDILTSSVASAIGGLITSVAQMLFFFGGGRRDSDNNPLSGVAAVLLIFLAPIASMFTQMAISRTREFDADETGAELARDPLALASALKKLEAGTVARPLQSNPQTEKVGFMMIANPFRGKGIKHLFSTHPPMDERIARLEEMAGYSR